MDADRDAVLDDIGAQRGAGSRARERLGDRRRTSGRPEDEASIAQQKLQFAKLKHQTYGHRS
jgi:transposase